jgi:hypothetical protein
MLITCYFYVKSVLIPPRIDASMIGARLGEKYIGFGGLDGSGMEVDDEILSKGVVDCYNMME